MKITYQVTLFFLIIIVLMIGGLALIYNRISVMNVAHQRLIKEWHELDIVLQFLDDIDEVMTTISLAPIDRADNQVIHESINRIASDLEFIRLQSIASESFEEAAHVMTEKQDFLDIYGDFQLFLTTLTGLNSNSPAVVMTAREALLAQLRQLREAGGRLQTFYMEGMKTASGSAQKLRKQILLRVIIMSIVLLLTVALLAVWFIHLINKNAQAILEREKGLTIGLMAQSLAHEIRNPLGIIKSSASVIKEKLPEQSEERELTDYLIGESDRISQLLEQLLHLNKDQSPELVLEKPASIIQEVLVLLAGACNKEKISIYCHNEAPEAVIACDRHQFKQVLINVLLNAIQASSVNSAIEITAYTKNKVFHIDISDSGQGFTKEALKKAFEPFFTTKNLGTGLGLFVAKNIMEGCGGTIEVSSPAGGGAKVTLKCKLAENKNV